MQLRDFPLPWLALAFSSTMGCSGTATLEDAGRDDTGAETRAGETRSGSRLRVLSWASEGGGLAFSGVLHDELLDVNCMMQTATDGRLRCLPATSWYDTAYADPECTERVVVRRSCDSDRYALGAPRPTASCDEPVGVPVYAIGATRTERMVYVPTGGCVAVPVEAGSSVVELGEELSPSEFVGAEVVVEGTERLAPRALVADDGAALATGIHDRELDAECAARSATASERCLPTARAFIIAPLFSDASCSAPIAIDTGLVPTCERARTAWDVSLRIGYQGYSRVGEEISGPRYSGTSRSCAIEMRADPPRAWAVGAPFAEEDFARLTLTSDGSARVVARRWVDEAGRALSHATELYDTETRMVCRPTLFPDGYRCISGTSVADLYYADAACSTPIVLRDASGGPAPMATSLHRSSDACDPVESDGVFAVGARVTPSSVWVRGMDSACRAYTPIPDAVFYARGEPIDAPALTLR
jgi:hypothetical protein